MKMTEKQHNKNAGFSLLEVILAMAILAIISIPLMNYFMESLKYSAKMRAKQEATIFAQQITEDLKSVKQPLIRIAEGETEYSVPYLSDASMGYVVAESDLNDAATANGPGTGKVRLTKTEDKFDTEIILSTDVSANEIARPILYGVDDTTDVLAVEHSETQEALAYFQAVNASYAVSSGTTVLSEDAIRQAMTREIKVKLGREGSYHTVFVCYEYSCGDLRGAGSTDSFTSTALLDVRIADLKRIYLLYDKVSETDALSHAKSDTVTFERSAEAGASVSPEVYLICQNPTERNDYRVVVKGLTGGQKIHTNIRLAGLGEASTGSVINEYGTLLTTEKLTEEGTPVRLVSITVNIYRKNHSAGEEPYASIQTTKGE